MTKFLPLLGAAAACALFAAPVQAGTTTFGSDLAAPATIIESHQADSAFWPTSIKGASPIAPDDGQITMIRLKGNVLTERGAGPPLNEVHFQTLAPTGSGGQMKVQLSSAPFYVPIDGDANKISEYVPENLCVKKGETVAFNDEGGFHYGGPGGALDYAHYQSGAPFQVFGAVANSTTAQFSADAKTKNGDTLTPKAIPGEELLMQVVMVTGDDRSYPCGGPPRDQNGNAIARMSVAPKQDAYVGGDGSFTIFGSCGDTKADCTGGTATVMVAGRPVATAAFTGKKVGALQIKMQLSAADLAKLAGSPGSAWTAAVTLTTPDQGTVTSDVRMHTTAGGLVHVVAPQSVYVRGNRQITPAGYCGAAAGCAGTATLAVKGKVVATAKFAAKTKGKITIKMRVPAGLFRQVKKGPVSAVLALVGTVGSDSATVKLTR